MFGMRICKEFTEHMIDGRRLERSDAENGTGPGRVQYVQYPASVDSIACFGEQFSIIGPVPFSAAPVFGGRSTSTPRTQFWVIFVEFPRRNGMVTAPEGLSARWDGSGCAEGVYHQIRTAPRGRQGGLLAS